MHDCAPASPGSPARRPSRTGRCCMARERAVAFGPGRVNLIGEHTDYNDGLALPFAISDGVTVGAGPREDHRISVTPPDLDAEDCFAIDSEPEAIQGWRGFARGIAAELRRAGVEL